MTPTERRRASGILLVLAAGCLVLAALALVAVALISQEPDMLRRVALPVGILALVGGFVALGGWRLDRRAADGLAEAQREAADSTERERRQRDELTEARRTRDRLVAAVRAERDWSRELRGQMMHMHRERGALGDYSDIRERVLRVTMQLVEAEKGLLLSRRDDDGDGDLDMVCAVGFEHDPEHSALAQRFAGEVIERDHIVRQNEAEPRPGDARASADEEIDCLLAIPIYIQDRFSGAVICANREGGFDEHDDHVLLALGDQAGAVLDNGRLHDELRSAYVGTVRVLCEAIEAKDRLLGEHSDLVSDYVGATAAELEMDAAARERLSFASLLHDVGKIGISEAILLKPGPLSPEERSVIELHPRIGARLVEQVPALRPLVPSILHHHERWDGDGYPSGLRGEEIPLEARLMSIADSFSAMVADRPYRRAMSVPEACQELERCAGTQFDPQLVRIFVAQVRRDEGRALERHSLSAAFDDPELAARLEPDVAVLGQRSMRLTDALTGLYGHRHLQETVAAETERATVQARPFAVLVVEVDLDRVNREQGYESGDGVLRAAGATVQAVAATAGGTACRLGARRLALVVPGAGEAQAEGLVGEVRRGLDGVVEEARVSAAVWRAGDRPQDVIARAQGRGLGAPVAPG